MKPFLFLALLSLAILGCSSDPRPLAYGSDACHHCKMTLMDNKFGTELVTDKGKVFVFDDINCMLSYLDSEEGSKQSYKHTLVTDYLNPGVLLDATTTHYLKSAEFRTPMASQVVAFGDFEKLKEHKAQTNGVYLAWGELVTQFK